MKNEQTSLASQIGRASAVIMIWSLVDKTLAIVKEILTARRFGVSASLDVFNVAYSFPGTIVAMFSGAVISALVPLYFEWRHQSYHDADSHATWLIFLNALFLFIIVLICLFFTPEIIQLIGYGFRPKEKQLAVIMERMLILLIFIDGVGILSRGILFAKKLFFHIYIAQLFVNISIIFFLSYDMGLDIFVLVWGFLIGTFLKTVYMFISLYREGFQYGIPLPFERQKMRAFWLLAIPMMGSNLIANSNLLVDQVMATRLPVGSVSILRYAFRINDFPIQVIILAISRALFPFISEAASVGNNDNLKKIYKFALIFLGFLTIPITCLIVLFSEDIVFILLKRGAFDLDASRQTAQALICYSLGLFFYAYTFVNGGFFAALQRTQTLLYMGIVSILLNIIFNVIFMKLIGVNGIALSTSVTLCIISIWFIFLLKQRLGISDLSKIFSSFYVILFAATCMLGTGYLLLSLFQIATTKSWIYLPITGILVCVSYLGIIWKFRTEDLNNCLNIFMRMINTFKKRSDSL